MSIKDLFGKRSNQIVTQSDVNKITKDIESVDLAEQQKEENQRFVPRTTIDFSDPKSFARYGSAEKYYEDAIAAVLNTYPYDGSQAEKKEWHNAASYIDNWLYENEYPKATGYIALNDVRLHPFDGFSVFSDGWTYKSLINPQYITLKGGPHPTPINKDKRLAKEYPFAIGRSNIWKPESFRNTNLYASGDIGNTVEFWWKADVESTTGTDCFFDMWNNVSPAVNEYGRFLIERYEGSFYVTYEFLGSGVRRQKVDVPENINFNNWNHYSFTCVNFEDQILVRLHTNGELVFEVTAGTSIGTIDWLAGGGLQAYIGAYQTAPTPDVEVEFAAMQPGLGAVQGSFDEFRYWKRARTSEQIGRNWYTSVGGGTNTDEANTDLGVYYKFNEGIVDQERTNPIDAVALDYSGRITNGKIINYMVVEMPPGSENFINTKILGSAINESGLNATEEPDPILFPTHPELVALKEKASIEGNAHDMTNNASIFHSIPEWITSADEKVGREELKNLSQVIASYFDTLHLQIEALPRLTDTHYVQEGEKPLPFAKHLLESVGFVAPEIFVDASVLEAIMSRNEERVFEENISDVKNIIYQNIYNNIANIYKAKGTEKSFRNLLRCFGIGDQLVKINLYGDGVTYSLEDNRKSVSVRKNYLSFNDADRYDSTCYQNENADNPDSRSFISGSPNGDELDYIPFTVQTEVIFPKKLPKDHPKFFPTTFREVSLFGMHEANPDNGEDLEWYGDDNCGFRVQAIKSEDESPDVLFRLQLFGFGKDGETFDSNIFFDTYDNQKWNFAVSVRPRAEVVDFVFGSDSEPDYVLEFVGYNMILDSVQNQFKIVVPLDDEPAKKALNCAKRIYVGSEYLDFDGGEAGNAGLQTRCDVKIGSTRFWLDYLTDEEIISHAKDATNYGKRDPYKPAYFCQTSVIPFHVPQSETLVLHWDFATVTPPTPSDGTDGGALDILSDSYFFVEDVSNGSVDAAGENSRYGWLGDILKYQHTGMGDYYYPEDRGNIDREYVFSSKQQLPEIINSNDMINILRQDDDLFVRGSRPTEYFWAIEKSMYQAISDEMINMFATITSFNNLIGEPVNRYRMEYKDLGKLRSLFFEKIDNEPSVERYVEFYKWLDSSISSMLQELIPASGNFSEEMRTMIESHVLERNKYWTKFPTLEMVGEPPEAPVLGINEMLYNWKFGHASVREDESCLWWKKRAERTRELSSGNPELDADKEAINKSITTVNSGSWSNRKLATGRATSDMQSYEGSTFALRSLSRLYRFGGNVERFVHGGKNHPQDKNTQYVKAETALGTENVIEVKQSLESANFLCTDENLYPLNKRKAKFEAANHAHESGSMQHFAKGSILSPYEMFVDVPKGEVYFSNLHDDSYGDDKEVSMQGVFTVEHVGGNQHRHVPYDLNAENTDRPEVWQLNFQNGSFNFTEPSDTRVRFFREEKAKRPVNIKNIKTSVDDRVLGNYSFLYEFVQTSGRTQNNSWFVDQFGIDAEKVFAKQSDTVFGHFDFELPDRGRNEHVFVERFSAPGSTYTNPRGMLDVEAEEFAVYNSLNFRNLDVRVHLKRWLTHHTRWGGYRSWYRQLPVRACWQIEPTVEHPNPGSVGDVGVFCEANFHKIHRNTKYMPQSFEYALSGTIYDKPPEVESDDPTLSEWLQLEQDNLSPLEQAIVTVVDVVGDALEDITKISVPDSICDDEVGGEVIEEGLFSDYRCRAVHDNWWHSHQLPQSGYQYSWINASVQNHGCPHRYAEDHPNARAQHPFIEMNPDSVNYGKMVIKKVISEHDDLRYETVLLESGFPFLNRFQTISTRSPRRYESVTMVDASTGEETLLESPCPTSWEGVNLVGDDIEKDTDWEKYESGEQTLNDLLLHRDGPYQHPSWKQIRNFENPVVVAQRKNNIFSVLNKPEIITLTSEFSSRRTTFRERRSQRATNFIEPVVAWNKPMQHRLGFAGSASAARVVHTYSNNLEAFANPLLIKRTGFTKSTVQMYDKIVEQYMREKNSYSPTFYGMNYSEYIFPKHQNVSLAKTRERLQYEEQSGKGSNGYDRRSSEIRKFWSDNPLDRKRTPYNPRSKDETALNALGKPVRNSSVWALDYFKYTSDRCLDGVSPARVSSDTEVMRGDLAWAGFAQMRGYVYEGENSDVGSEELRNAWIAPRPTLQYIHNPNSTQAKEDGWEWKAGQISGMAPWYDNYKDFSIDTRSIGQNYSLLPEFRVSPHMDFYVNDKAGNFRAENKNAFEMVGAASALTSSADYFSTPVEFYSYDGISAVDEYRFEPNNANGFKEILSGRMAGTIMCPIDKLCINEPPADIDSIDRAWTCAEPYPVALLNKVTREDFPNFKPTRLPLLLKNSDQYMSVDLSALNQGDSLSTTIQRMTSFAAAVLPPVKSYDGLPVGHGPKNIVGGTNGWTSDNYEEDYEMWENTFMVSFWVNLDNDISASDGVGGFHLKSSDSDSTASAIFGADSAILKRVFKVSTDVELKSILREKTFAINKKTGVIDNSPKIYDDCLQLSKLNGLKKIGKKGAEQIRKIKKRLDNYEILSRDTSEAASFYLSDKSDEQGRACWVDTIGNKVHFDVSPFSEQTSKKIDTGRWTHISVMYIGGSEVDEQFTGITSAHYSATHGYCPSHHRVFMFVNGEYVPSTMYRSEQFLEQISHPSIENPPQINNGTLHMGTPRVSNKSIKDFGASRAGFIFGKCMAVSPAKTQDFMYTMDSAVIKGKVSDVALIQGGEYGIISEVSPDSTKFPTSSEQNFVAKNKWFFDNSSPLPNGFRSTLVEKIFEKQCEDVNEIIAEWEEVECQERTTTQTKVVTPPPVLNATPDILLDPTNFDTSVFTNPVFNLKISAADAVEQGASEEEVGDSSMVDLIPKTYSLALGAFLDLNLGKSIWTPGKNSPSWLPDNFGVSNLNVQTREPNCPKLVGYWKMGIPRYRKETCEAYTWTEDFFKCYAHTDPINHLSKVSANHKQLGTRAKPVFRLEVDAVKKLLPYNGFYPSQRAVQLGSLFYDSISPFVVGENDNQAWDRARTEQALLQPFFAPGILFNSIKSGIAVDWAAYSGKHGETYITMKDEVLGRFHIVEREDKNPDDIKISSLMNTVAGLAVSNRATKLLSRDVMLGKVSQVNAASRFNDYYQKALKTTGKEFARFQTRSSLACKTQDYEKWCKDNGFNPNDKDTQNKFKEQHCQDISWTYESNYTVSIPRGLKSLVGKSQIQLSGSPFEISKLATGLVSEISKLPTAVAATYDDEVRKISEIDLEGSYLDTEPTLRIPFEGLVSIDSVLPIKNSRELSKIFLLAPSYYLERFEVDNINFENLGNVQSPNGNQGNLRYPYFEWTGDKNPLYEMAMHNFLAEIPNFFLKTKGFTTFASKPEKDFKTVTKGTSYYMDVHLYKTDGFDMTKSPFDGVTVNVGSDLEDADGNPYTTEGRYFGPAVRCKPKQAAVKERFYIGDPSQAPYVPPYFYGRAKARLVYKPERDGQPTLDEILNNVEIEYINEEMEAIFASKGSDPSQSKEVREGGGLFSVIQNRLLEKDRESWEDVPAFKARMPMEASINFYGKTKQRNVSYDVLHSPYEFNPSDETKELFTPRTAQDTVEGASVWTISPKFECPTLNFNTPENLETRVYNIDDTVVFNEKDNTIGGTGFFGQESVLPAKNYVSELEKGQAACLTDNDRDLYGPVERSARGTGMWSGYGQLPKKDEGIFISLEESFKRRVSMRDALICTEESSVSDIPTVNIALRDDVRYVHGNIIELKDPFGRIDTITIGQPRDAKNNIKPKAASDVNTEKLFGVPAESALYTPNAAIQTIATTEASTVPVFPDAGMQGSYNIEAYFEAENWATNPTMLWGETSSSVPLPLDVANALCYHTNYRYYNENTFNWKAKIVWLHNKYQAQAVGAALNVPNDVKSGVPGHSVIVEFSWEPDITDPQFAGRAREYDMPSLTLASVQDNLNNPLGRLGMRYIGEETPLDFSWDSLDPETQRDRKFYPQQSQETIIRCVKRVGSLIDVCGFEPARSRIGDIADEKEISEAVVMIPFVDNPVTGKSYANTIEVMGRNFFKISKNLFKTTKRNIESGKPAIEVGGAYKVEEDIPETSVSDMIKKMQRYNLPPALDFLRFPLKSGEFPFVMYIFEFTETLDKQDLANIWQGLMPKCATRASKQTVAIEHPMDKINFYEGRSLPSDVRWMVFRAKRKAQTDYFKVTSDSSDDDRFQFEFEVGRKQPDYGYNWPYDFFSLVELGKVRGGIDILPSIEEVVADDDDVIKKDVGEKILDAHATAGTLAQKLQGVIPKKGDE